MLDGRSNAYVEAMNLFSSVDRRRQGANV